MNWKRDLSRETEKRRIKAIRASIDRKRGGPDLSRLSETQLAWYQRWRKNVADFAAKFEDPGDCYGASLTPEYADDWPLRSDIQRELFGNDSFEVLLEDTEEDAARKYQLALEQQHGFRNS